MAQASQQIDFPTLGVTIQWVPAHCVVPDGFDKGKPFEMVPWQLWALANFYRVKPKARFGQLAPAFHYRRGQIVLPQKAGKAPYTAAHVCVEGVGPALFGGWAEGGEVWDCRDHDCGCGFVYEYQPGEAMGMRWPTPLIQITAYSEDQTDNIYDALRPMIDDGPLAEVIPRTGEEFIRLPNKGRIDVVTSNALSRLGQRVTYVPQDETGIWLELNGMRKVAETQRRGLAGMGGRAEETTNSWDPTQESVAQRTAEAAAKDIFRHHPLAPAGLSYMNKRERRKIHRVVYEGCKWIDHDAIDSEASELIETDPAQAERFFGNRVQAGESKAFHPDRWDENERDYRPDDGAFIVLAADGARFLDDLAVIATEIETGFQWPIGIWSRPLNAPDSYEHPMDEVDGAVMEAVEDLYKVWRIYIDPGSSTGNIDPLVEKWQGRWGDGPVTKWLMNRPKQTAFAVSNYTAAINTAAVTHDGDPKFSQHVKNAVRWPVNAYDDNKRQLHVIGKDRPGSPDKIDGAAAGVLSWEARGDAVAAAADPSDAISAAPSTVIFAGI